MGTIAKVQVNGTTHLTASTAFAFCTSSASTVAKTANMQDNNEFTLFVGVTVHVRFTYSNTATNPTLNLNNTGAKPIMRYGYTNVGTTPATSWQAESVVCFTYDGTNWQMNGSSGNDTTDTTYSLSGNLSSHTFTSTLTPSTGLPTTSSLTLAEGNNVTLTDSGSTITINATDTTYTTGTGLQISGNTISFENGYGDSQNPYTSKSQNYVLAAPSSASGTPSFRPLVVNDIPNLSSLYVSTASSGAYGSSEIGNSNGSISLVTQDDNSKWASINLGYSGSDGNIDMQVSDGTDITSYIGLTEQGTYVQGLVTPSNDSDAATKKYVDDSIGAAGGGTITEVKTNAGTHTIIDVTSGKAEFNVPTNTSHLTNDSGYITASSPALTGTPTAPTPTSSSSNTQIATKKYVDDAVGSAGGGTITGVTAGTGLSGGGTIGSVTLNHSNSVTAQTTQAVYPIKIDAQGHISSYGSAVTIPTVPSETANSTTGISIADHTTTTITGVTSSTTSVTGVQSSTTTASKASGANSTIPTLGDPIPVITTTDITVPIKNASATTVPIKNTSSTTVPIKNTSATTVPVVSSNDDATLSFSVDEETELLTISWTLTPTRTVFGTATSIYGVQSSTTSVTGVQSSTTSVTGVQSSTTTASYVSVTDSETDYGVTSAGSASTWSFTDVTVPIKNTSSTTVPIKSSSSTTVVTSATHSITDNGHTHII